MTKKQNEIEPEIIESEVVETAVSDGNYKYLCPACTNEAFYLHKGSPMRSGTVKCPHCGKATEYDDTNLVRLS